MALIIIQIAFFSDHKNNCLLIIKYRQKIEYSEHLIVRPHHSDDHSEGVVFFCPFFFSSKEHFEKHEWTANSQGVLKCLLLSSENP